MQLKFKINKIKHGISTKKHASNQALKKESCEAMTICIMLKQKGKKGK